MSTKFTTDDGYTLTLATVDGHEVFTDGDLSYDVDMQGADGSSELVPVPLVGMDQTLDGVLEHDGRRFEVTWCDEQWMAFVTELDNPASPAVEVTHV